MNRIAIDIGGTFTDLVVVEDGTVRTEKAPSTPSDPSEGAISVLEKANVDHDKVDVFDHGTTVATNVTIERNPGAEVVFLTNDGFEDIPEIMRTERENQYDRQWEKPDPLVQREHRYGIPGRVSVDGEVLTELDTGIARDIIESYAAKETETSYAISMLYSFSNPSQERQLVELIEEIDPNAYISASHEIFPQAKEYERASTVIANAYVKSKMQQYIANLDETFGEEGSNTPINIMQSNGGLLPVSEVINVPAKTLFSGVAAGVSGGSHFGSNSDENLITMDMGGTSCDVGLITDGVPEFTTEGEIQWGMPVQFPQVDIETIGAGGGSIAWIDSGGHLKVGPQSAGASPGPVCYGRGGTEPTITDANIVLGRLNPDNFLGGDIDLDVEAAHRSIEKLGNELGMEVKETALGILEISTNKLTQAMRSMTVERGYDPRDFGLVAFGGAGPMHVLKVASIANVPRAIVPPNPGVLSASGLLTTNFRYDQLRSFIYPLPEMKGKRLSTLNEVVSDLVDDGTALLQGQEELVTDINFKISADLRYEEQAYEVTVPVTSSLPIDEIDIERAAERFHEKHERLYGHSNVDGNVEFVNVHVTTIGERPEPPAMQQNSKKNGKSVTDAITATREVTYSDGTYETPIYDRTSIPIGATIEGPCVIEEDQSTTVVFPEQTAQVDEYNNIIAEVKE